MKKLIILFLIFFFPTTVFAAWSDCNIWVDNTFTRYRQEGTDGTSGNSTLTIKLAKNEIQSFQVLFYNAHASNAQNVDDVTVTEGTSTITYLKVFKQHYFNLDGTYKSVCGATTGYVPEVLIPKVDEVYGETRNGPDGFPSTTYPYSVVAQKVQGFWIDVGTDSSTPAGTYTLNVAVKGAGETDKTATITVQVWDFTLPSTSTIKTALTFSDTYLNGSSHGLTGTEAYMRTRIANMTKLLLYHRLGGIYLNGNPTILSYDANGNVVYWGYFETAYGAALDGTAIASGPYAGAKLNVMGAQIWGTGADTQAHYTTALTDWWNKFGTTWTQDQMYLWASPDEPTCDTQTHWGETKTAYQIIASKAKVFYDLNGGLRKTFPTKERRASTICSEADLINPGAGYTSFDTTGIYNPLNVMSSYTTIQGSSFKIARNTYPNYYNWTNRDHWIYTSNMSHGGNWNEDSGGLTGQVDTVIDLPPVLTRLMAWTMWYYRQHGYLYYDIVHSWQSASTSPYNQPFNNIANEGGQGDGTWIWPGVTDCSGRDPGCATGTPSIGGINDTILGGITLKLLRDTMQDREYMELARTNRSEALTDVVNKLVFTDFEPNTCSNQPAGCSVATEGEGPFYCLNTGVANLLTQREALANLILGGGKSITIGAGSQSITSGGSLSITIVSP